MTEGEKMIWAAAYVAALSEIGNPPPYLLGTEKREARREWEKGQIVVAVEEGTNAVDYARESIGDVEEGYGDLYDVLKNLREMLND
jgi:hypothetical protein